MTIHADGQADMTKLTLAFRNFSKAPKKNIFFYPERKGQWTNNTKWILMKFDVCVCVCVCVDRFHVAQEKNIILWNVFRTKFLDNQRHYQLLRKDAVPER